MTCGWTCAPNSPPARASDLPSPLEAVCRIYENAFSSQGANTGRNARSAEGNTGSKINLLRLDLLLWLATFPRIGVQLARWPCFVFVHGEHGYSGAGGIPTYSAGVFPASPGHRPTPSRRHTKSRHMLASGRLLHPDALPLHLSFGNAISPTDPR